MHQLTGFILFLSIICIQFADAYRELFKWKQLEYEDLPPPTGSIVTDYIAYNNVPLGVSRYGSRYFVTVPRRGAGIPSTLNVVDVKNPSQSNQCPKLRPYPDYKTNTPLIPAKPIPDRIISVYRSRVDDCGRLWFIDSGLLEIPGNKTQVQPPSIWIFNLKNDHLIHRYELPPALHNDADGYMSMTIDVEPTDCSNAFAYFPNMRTSNVHVYSLKQDKVWTTHHNYYHIEPLSGDFSVAGFDFQWTDGVFSVALGPKNADGYKWAYFHAMTALSEFRVSTKVLRNESLATRSFHGKDFEYVGTRASGLQANLHDINPNTGIMYYAEAQNNAVACWNINTPHQIYNHRNVLKDDVGMIYPSDLKLDHDNHVLVLANKIVIYSYGTLDVNDYNFRVWNFKPPQSCNNSLPVSLRT